MIRRAHRRAAARGRRAGCRADLRDHRRHGRARRRLASRSRTARSSSATAGSSRPGDVRLKLPAGTQVIDATGKWVTPGIVAGFSRLGLAEVDLSARRRRRHQRRTGRSAPRSTSSRRSTRWTRPIAVNRADGVTRAIVAPSAGKSIFAGQGAVIDTGADMDPITARAEVPVRRARRDRRGQGRRLARLGPRPVPQRAARGARAAPLCAADRGGARRAPDERERPVVRNPERIAALRRRRRRSEDVLLTRFDAAALVPVLQGRQYLLVHVERASDILQVLDAQARIPVAEDRAGRRERRLDRRRPDRARRRAGDRLGGERPAGIVRAARRDPVERRPDARRRRQGRRSA